MLWSQSSVETWDTVKADTVRWIQFVSHSKDICEVQKRKIICQPPIQPTASSCKTCSNLFCRGPHLGVSFYIYDSAPEAKNSETPADWGLHNQVIDPGELIITNLKLNVEVHSRELGTRGSPLHVLSRQRSYALKKSAGKWSVEPQKVCPKLPAAGLFVEGSLCTILYTTMITFKLWD